MADDGAKARYFGGLSLFMFSMIGITVADNLIMIFVFWELVGFSSYSTDFSLFYYRRGCTGFQEGIYC